MKFSAGDKMLIKKTGEEGLVVAVLDDKMAEVKVGKTTFLIYIEDIDHPYLTWFTKKNKDEQKKKTLLEQIPIEKSLLKVPKVPSGIHLTFMPVFDIIEMEECVERVKIFLVNDSQYTVELRYDVRLGSKLLFHYSGTIQPFTDLYLHYIDWNTMQEIPRFEWSLKEVNSNQYAVHQDILKIRSTKLFEKITSLQQTNNPTFQYILLEEFSQKPKYKEPFKLDLIIPKTKSSLNSIHEIPKYEVDLHIEQIIDDAIGLSNADMLSLQLCELNKYLRLAVHHKQEKIVIIHGNGKGVLRNEVQKILKDNFFIAKIESGWQAGYGFGATIAYFKF